MPKILIVDDFLADRKSIRDIIKAFKDKNIEIAGECENGLKALEIIDALKPDIIISDIEMPYCDGFELAKKVRINYPKIKIIFCSLYDEFEYAKRALYFDSYGYILKPVDPKELKQCIEKVNESLQDENTQAEQYKDYENIKMVLEGYKPILAQNLIKDLVLGLYKNKSEGIWDKIGYLEAGLKNGSYCLIYFEIDDFDKLINGQGIEKQQLFSMKVFEKVKELLDNNILTRIDDSHIVCILSFDPAINTEDAQKSANEYSNKILMSFKKSDVSLTISVSGCCSDIFEINNLYEQCIYLRKHKFSLGKGRIILSDDVPSYNINTDIDFNSVLKEIRYLINSGTHEEIRSYIDSLFLSFPRNSGEQYLKNLCFCIVICVQIVLNENNDNFKEVFNSESLIWEKLLKFETIIDTGNWLKNILISINGYLSNKSRNKNRLISEEIKKYIEKNYVKNFSLDVLAADLYYSQNYLNRVFKQETGESIFDYATRYRIEIAKEMLSDPRIKFYEISDKLGYSNSAYFSYVFKKFTGLNPNDYRERFVK